MEVFPRHFREQPTDWGSLIDASNVAISDQADPILQAEELYATISQQLDLDPTKLDENRYWALGSAMCQLEVMLKDSSIQTSIEADGIRILSSYLYWFREEALGVRLQDVSSRDVAPRGNIARAFLDAGRLATGMTEAGQPGFRLLGNTLERLAIDTRSIRSFGRDSMYSYESIVNDELFPDSLARTSTASATKIIQKALIVRRQEQTGQTYDVVMNEDPLISAILGDTSLKGLAVLGASHRLTRTRVDLCEAWLISDMAETNEKGNLTFNPPKALPPPTQRNPREEILICPAHTVEGLIPRIYGIVRDILERTDEALAANWLERHSET